MIPLALLIGLYALLIGASFIGWFVPWVEARSGEDCGETDDVEPRTYDPRPDPRTHPEYWTE